MGVVKLNGDLVGEFGPGTLSLLEPANDIEERGSAPEVLLLQTELLTTLKAVLLLDIILWISRLYSLVVGVENGGDGLGTLLISYRALVFARVELLEVKLAASSFAAPKTQIVASAGLVSRN